jgi:decaprenyl-phosphate phosphoribosyltransferase
MTSQSDDGLDFAARGSLLRSIQTELVLSNFLPILKLLRPHQWAKNAFVAAPLFFTPAALSTDTVLLVLAGMASFCLVSSAVYVLNDWVDREADRLHPKKRHRPIASGRVGPGAALATFVVALAGGLALATWLDPLFGAVAALYFAVNLAYCFLLKNLSLIDVLTITLSFVLRVVAGATLIQSEVSVWILMCTGLIALFLALAKRRDDLVKAMDGSHRPALEGYTKPFLDAAVTVVLGALLVAYTMYATDEEVAGRLNTEQIYLTVPFVLAGILRYLQIALVEERSGSPTVVVLSDAFLIGCMALWVATFALLIYL